MADFYYNLKFDIKGETEINRAERAFRNMGLNIEKVVNKKKGLGTFHIKGINNLQAVNTELQRMIRLMDDAQKERFHQTFEKTKDFANAAKDRENALKAEHNTRRKLDQDYEKQFAALLKEEADEKRKHDDDQRRRTTSMYRDMFDNIENERTKREQAIRSTQAAVAQATANERKDRQAAHAEEQRHWRDRQAAAREHQREMNRVFAETRRQERARIAERNGVANRAGIVAAGGAIGAGYGFHMFGRAIGTLAHTAEQVARHMGNAFKESIEFNDEIQRSKTIFKGLGLLGTGKSIQQIKLNGTAAEREQLRRSEGMSERVSSSLLAESAYTGQSFSAVMGGAKSFLPDMIDKMSKATGAKDNPLLKNEEMLSGVVRKMIRLATVVKMTDPKDRPLSFYTYGFNELLAGTSGGKKDTGKEMVKSFRTRFGINIRPEDALPMAQAVNKGDFPKFLELLISRLEKAGVSANKLADLMGETLQPNVEGVSTQLKMIGAEITKPVYKTLIRFFQEVREYLNDGLNYKPFMAFMEGIGENINKWVGSKIEYFWKFVQYLETSEGGKWIELQISKLEYFGAIMEGVITLVAEFWAGFLDLEGLKFTNVHDVKQATENIRKAVVEAAPSVRTIGAGFATMADAIVRMAPYLIPLAKVLAYATAGGAMGFVAGGLPGMLGGTAIGAGLGIVSEGAGFSSNGIRPGMFPGSLMNPSLNAPIPAMPYRQQIAVPQPAKTSSSVTNVYKIGTISLPNATDADSFAKSMQAEQAKSPQDMINAYLGVTG